MFKKCISILLVFSIFISDLTGWGSKPLSAMMESDEGVAEGHSIPVQSKDTQSIQKEILKDLKTTKLLPGSDQSTPVILDLGQGIVSSSANDLSLLNSSSLSHATFQEAGEGTPSQKNNSSSNAPRKQQGSSSISLIDFNEASALLQGNPYALQQQSFQKKRASKGGELSNFSEAEGTGLEDYGEEPHHNLPALSPEAEEFLNYVQHRIIEGKLNWKQILGIFGGIVTGAGVA